MRDEEQPLRISHPIQGLDSRRLKETPTDAQRREETVRITDDAKKERTNRHMAPIKEKHAFI